MGPSRAYTLPIVCRFSRFALSRLGALAIPPLGLTGEKCGLAFGIRVDKDVVRRILGAHYRPESDGGGPSWLTFLGHTKDSLWSCDLFRCESATLRTH